MSVSRASLGLLALLAASLCVNAKGPAAAPKEQVLALDGSATARRLVASLPDLEWPVMTPRFQFYRSPADPKDLGWLIDPEAMIVARVRLSGASLQRIRFWDFSAVAPPESVDDRVTRILHPVLYPVGRDRWAMAVLTSHSTMYSGGGASWTWATFHELMDLSAPAKATEGALELLHQAIPFGCSKSIRACFSEKEYKTSGNCQESWNGILRLRYGTPDRQGAHPWTAIWEEMHVPGGTKKGKSTVARNTINLDDPPETQCTEPMD